MNVYVGERKYEASEWENIPSIIPMVFNQINNLMNSVNSWIDMKNSEEPLSSINNKIKVVERLID